MASSTSLPAVASLWIGDRLNWLHELSLASFVQRGHEVVLFHTAPSPPPVPAGVRTCPAAEIWDAAAAGHGEAPASMLSDLFRALSAEADRDDLDRHRHALLPAAAGCGLPRGV